MTHLAPSAPLPSVEELTLACGTHTHTALAREAALLTGGFVDGPYRFEILEGASHWLPEEAPGRIIPLLLDHLAASPLA